MATRKAPITQAVKALRAGLAKLKRLGIFKGDARNAKGGWRQKALVKEYAPVLEGKAKVVKVGKAAKQFDKTFHPKNERIIVNIQKNETARFDKKTGQIVVTGKNYGVKYKRRILPKGINPFQNLPVAPKGKIYLFQMPDGFRYDREGAQQFLNKYKHHKGVGDTVSILEYDEDDFPGMDDEE